jgi:hypothetical protein
LNEYRVTNPKVLIRDPTTNAAVQQQRDFLPPPQPDIRAQGGKRVRSNGKPFRKTNS